MATGSETKIGIDRLTGTMGVDFQNLITQLLTATQ
jgi:hypothetical protein